MKSIVSYTLKTAATVNDIFASNKKVAALAAGEYYLSVASLDKGKYNTGYTLAATA